MAVMSYITRLHGITNLKVSGELPYNYDMALGVRRDWPELVPILQKALDSITEAEKNAILDKWFATEIEHQIDYTRQWQIAGVALLIILIILYWNRKLAHSRAVLRSQRATTQRYLDTVQTLIVALDKKGTITMLNRAGCELLGYAPDEIVGCNWFDTCLPQPEGHETIFPMFERTMKGDLEGEKYFENTVLCRDGGQRLIAWHNAYLRDELGHITGVLCSGEDITARKAAEEKLRQSQQNLERERQRFFSILDALPMFIYLQAPDYSIRYANRTFIETFGEPGERPCYAVIARRETPCLRCPTFQVFQHQDLEKWEWDDGNGQVYQIIDHPFTDVDGSDLVIEIGLDITESKKAEVALHQSEQRFKSLFEFLPIAITIHDANTGEPLDANPVTHLRYGYDSREELFARSMWSDPPYSETEAVAYIRRAATGEPQHFEWFTQTPGGISFWEEVWLQKITIEGQDFVLAAAADLSARKQMETELRNAVIERQTAEHFAHSVIDALSAHLCVLDDNGKVLMVNRAWREFADANPPAPPNYGVGTNYLQVCGGEESSCDFNNQLKTVMQSEASTFQDEYPCNLSHQLSVLMQGGISKFQYEYPCHSRQEQRWFVAYFTRFEVNGLVRIVVAHENITVRKLAENAIRANEARYRALIAAMTEGVVMQNQSGEIVECNESAERILGLSRDQMMGRTSLDPRWRAVYEDGSPFPGEAHPNPVALRTGQAQRDILQGIHTPEGKLRWLSVNATPLFHLGENEPYAVVATFSDITAMRDSHIELEKQRATLQAVLDHAPVGIQVFAPDGTVRLCNRMAERLVGREILENVELEALNQTYAVFIHGTDTLYPTHKMPLVKALLGETCMVEDMELRHPDGSKVLLQVIAAPIREQRESGNGEVTTAVAIFQDISERWQTQQDLDRERRRLRVLINTIPDLIWYKDIKGRYLGCNRRFEDFFGASETVIQGKTDYDFVDRELADLFRHHDQRAMAADGPLVNEEYITFPDGHTELLETTKAIMRDRNGQMFGVLGIGHNITKRKQTEQELIHAREAADAANHAKSAFLANMSHELRTPLNAVLGFAQIVLQSPDLAEDLRGYIEKIRRGGDYLLTLINDILDLSKIEAGRIELYPEEFKAQGFFEDISDMFRFRAEQKGIDFHYRADASLPHCLQADNKRLRQVVLNLLSNAVKFTTEGHVALSVAYQDGYLRLCVEDTGIGIASEDLPAIFRPFTQTGESCYKSQGTGLGLSITRKIVELMGGEISVDSEPGKGSRFHVQIPLEAGFDHPLAEADETDVAPQEEILGYRRTDSSDAPQRILIVDDIADNREVLEHILASLAFTVQTADSGETCVQKAPQFQPDAVLIDMRMPGINGLEAMQQLHALPGMKNLPVIIISASVYHEDRETALQQGCVAYLNKPIEQQVLFQTLEKYLPLAWKYATTAPNVTPPEISNFPAAWLDALAYAVSMGNRRQILALLQEQREQGVSLPDKLQAWVEAYEYSYILEWIKQVDPES
jgi:PAS domain S-box-containing protein